jgi:hypothetical protein
VLADQGLPAEAGRLLAAADEHPLAGRSATLYCGSAGVALTHLAMYRHTRDERHVDRAVALMSALPADGDLTPLLGPDDATGLLHGRTGIALALHRVGTLTGDRTLLDRGVRLLHAELDRAVPLPHRADDPAAALTFPISATDPRRMPYLYCGSAGVALVVARYLSDFPDDRLTAALPRLLAAARTVYTVMPGLFQGLAGLGLVHLELGRRDDAVRIARALFKYAVPDPTGVRFLGDQSLRYSAELCSGSAGVLLFLSQLLDPRPDPLCLADEAHPPTPTSRAYAQSSAGIS